MKTPQTTELIERAAEVAKRVLYELRDPNAATNCTGGNLHNRSIRLVHAGMLDALQSIQSSLEGADDEFIATLNWLETVVLEKPEADFKRIFALIRDAQQQAGVDRDAVLEEAARVAESDDLILSESRSPASFGRCRKDHGELIALHIRALKQSPAPLPVQSTPVADTAEKLANRIGGTFVPREQSDALPMQEPAPLPVHVEEGERS